MSGRALRRLAWLCVVLASGVSSALASPPFVLDDGDVQGVGDLDLDVGPMASFGRDETSGALPFLEADVGLLRGVEADIVAPVAFAAPRGHGVVAGAGGVELEAKISVVDQSASAAPSVALGPTLILPTGSATRGLGQGSPALLLPVWFSKDLGRWTVFGGGGPAIGHGGGERDSILFGSGLAGEVADAWHVGVELHETTRAARRACSRSMSAWSGTCRRRSSCSPLSDVASALAGLPTWPASPSACR